MSTSVSNLPQSNIHNDPSIPDINTSVPQQISPASKKHTEGPHKTLTETSSIQSRNVSTQNPKHPHLGNFSEEINEINQPKTQVVDAGIIDRLLSKGIIDKNGNINFKKYGANKAKLSGSIYIENGKLQVNIEGNCGPEAAKILQQLKAEVNGGKPGPITLDPQIIGISKTDKDLLARGGQIQYKTLSNGKILKMTLDPGENGQGDGLTLSVWGRKGNKKTQKIPLSVVFEGQSYNDFSALKDGKPILKNWREQKLFENSAIKIDTEKLFFFFKQTLSDNTNNIGRTEAQNTLWHAVYEYLRITGEQPNTLQPQPSAPSPQNKTQEIPKEAPVQPTPTEVLKTETPTAAASIPIGEGIIQHANGEPLRSLTSPKAKANTPKKPSQRLLDDLSDAISALRNTLASQDPNQDPNQVEHPTVEGFATKPSQAAMAEVVEIPQVQMVETPQPTSVEQNTLGLKPQQAIEEETAVTPPSDKKSPSVITSAILGGIAETEKQNLVDAANAVSRALQDLLKLLNENNEPVQEALKQALKQAQGAVLALESQIPETEKLQQATLLAGNLTALAQALKGNSTAKPDLQPLLNAAQSLYTAISDLAQPSVFQTEQAATRISNPQESLKAIKVKPTLRVVKNVRPEVNNEKLKEGLKSVNKIFEEARETVKADPTATTDTEPTTVKTETYGAIPVNETTAATSVKTRAARKSISEKDASKQRKAELVKATKGVCDELQTLVRDTMRH